MIVSSAVCVCVCVLEGLDAPVESERECVKECKLSAHARGPDKKSYFNLNIENNNQRNE